MHEGASAVHGGLGLFEEEENVEDVVDEGGVNSFSSRTNVEEAVIESRGGGAPLLRRSEASYFSGLRATPFFEKINQHKTWSWTEGHREFRLLHDFCFSSFGFGNTNVSRFFLVSGSGSGGRALTPGSDPHCAQHHRNYSAHNADAMSSGVGKTNTSSLYCCF